MGVSKDQTDHLTRMDKRPLEEGADSAGHEEVLHLQVDQTNGESAQTEGQPSSLRSTFAKVQGFGRTFNRSFAISY